MRRSRTSERRAIGGFVSLALFVGMSVVVATPSAAQHTGGNAHGAPVGGAVTNPGEVAFTITGGLLSLNDGARGFELGGDAPGVQPHPATLTGTIDEDGHVHVPAAALDLTRRTLPDDDAIQVRIRPLGDVTGHLDARTGALSLDVGLQFIIDGGFLGPCGVTVPMHLSTEHDGGVRYTKSGANAGSAVLAADAFAVPASMQIGPLPTLCQPLNTVVGLPAPAGVNIAVLELETDPVIKGTVVGVGQENLTRSICEAQLGGEWSNVKGVKSCTTEEWRVETELSPLLNTGGSGTNRWRAQVLKTTSTLWQLTDSQRGVPGAHGTDESLGHDEVVLDSHVDFEIVVCQQGPALGTNFQDRPLDSPQCIALMESYVASLG